MLWSEIKQQGPSPASAALGSWCQAPLPVGWARLRQRAGPGAGLGCPATGHWAAAAAPALKSRPAARGTPQCPPWTEAASGSAPVAHTHQLSMHVATKAASPQLSIAGYHTSGLPVIHLDQHATSYLSPPCTALLACCHKATCSIHAHFVEPQERYL